MNAIGIDFISALCVDDCLLANKSVSPMKASFTSWTQSINLYILDDYKTRVPLLCFIYINRLYERFLLILFVVYVIRLIDSIYVIMTSTSRFCIGEELYNCTKPRRALSVTWSIVFTIEEEMRYLTFLKLS
jgi:hypothetical protein